MTRLFVAAWPPSAVVERWSDQLADVLRPVGGEEQSVRPVPAQNLHVTLRFLGDVDATEAIERLSARAFPAATAHVRPAVVQLGAKQLVIPVDGVDGVARAVHEATLGLGQPSSRDFFGHLTVARVRKAARFVIEGTPFDATFLVDEIRLVESRLDPAGAVYTTLRSFPTV